MTTSGWQRLAMAAMAAMVAWATWASADDKPGAKDGAKDGKSVSSAKAPAATANGAKAEKPAPPTTAPADDGGPVPCPSPVTSRPAGTKGGEISRFATGSPFDVEYKPPVIREGKRMWAKSFLWEDAPKFVVEKWLTDEPKTKGKYVLIEFWATWCPPCRKSINLLNDLHRKFGKDLVVIGISHESEQDVRRLKKPAIEYFSAIDTQARMKNAVGVWGIPHVLLLEPGGCVIWEGFPLLKGYELTEKTVERILAVGRKTGAIKGE